MYFEKGGSSMEGAAVRGRSRRRQPKPRKKFLDVVKSLWSKSKGLLFWIVFFIILFNAIPIGLWLIKSFFKLLIWFLSLPLVAAIIIAVLIAVVILAAYIWF